MAKWRRAGHLVAGCSMCNSTCSRDGCTNPCNFGYMHGVLECAVMLWKRVTGLEQLPPCASGGGIHCFNHEQHHLEAEETPDGLEWYYRNRSTGESRCLN